MCYCLLFIFALLGLELEAYHMLGKCFPSEPYSPPITGESSQVFSHWAMLGTLHWRILGKHSTSGLHLQPQLSVLINFISAIQYSSRWPHMFLIIETDSNMIKDPGFLLVGSLTVWFVLICLFVYCCSLVVMGGTYTWGWRFLNIVIFGECVCKCTHATAYIQRSENNL